MRIDGEWLLCDDGIIRPVIRGEILTANGAWQSAEFLVDAKQSDLTLPPELVARANQAVTDLILGIPKSEYYSLA